MGVEVKENRVVEEEEEEEGVVGEEVTMEDPLEGVKEEAQAALSHAILLLVSHLWVHCMHQSTLLSESVHYLSTP